MTFGARFQPKGKVGISAQLGGLAFPRVFHIRAKAVHSQFGSLSHAYLRFLGADAQGTYTLDNISGPRDSGLARLTIMRSARPDSGILVCPWLGRAPWILPVNPAYVLAISIYNKMSYSAQINNKSSDNLIQGQFLGWNREHAVPRGILVHYNEVSLGGQSFSEAPESIPHTELGRRFEGASDPESFAGP
ncbi:hypothetical protein CROQUDRAFT_110125 [Cronartium quercuum f. sp. fusiforme G11]|uniref:Uncharacterized protein n=1 Tax=Cronartium quercuum f. sp. fusiforme G11 TaxID=708437 RepID=A0A9P6N9V6_9BASI|nr:hypothetical protein CROQUDRAFT_110125 [Cronartium quercuum f. sp. fusiforme G11]